MEKAVDSVLSQTYQVRELILIDDGSDDGTWEYIEKLSCDTVSLVKKRLEHCGMPGAVRNRGIELAANDWIAFLDSDDYWLERKIEQQVRAVETGNAKFCHTREIWRRGATELSQKTQTHRKSGHVFEDALKKCIIGPSTVLMHRSLIEQCGVFAEDLEIAEDYEYWLRITAQEKVVYVEQPSIVKYSGGHFQLSGKYEHIENFRIAALERLVQNDYFTAEQRKMAWAELQRKKAIWARGAIKRRGRYENKIQQ